MYCLDSLISEHVDFITYVQRGERRWHRRIFGEYGGHVWIREALELRDEPQQKRESGRGGPSQVLFRRPVCWREYV